MSIAFDNTTLLQVLKAIGIACALWVLGYFIGQLLRYIVRVVLGKVGFDEWIRKTGFGKAIKRTGLQPHEFFGSLAAWITYLVFIVLGILGFGYILGNTGVVEAAQTVLYVYIAGGLKLLLIILIGFTLVDAFVGYIYKVTELRSEMQLLYPMAEYLRIVLYISIVVYGVEQSGLGVGILPSMLSPLIWGITIMTTLIIIYLIIQASRAPKPLEQQ